MKKGFFLFSIFAVTLAFTSNANNSINFIRESLHKSISVYSANKKAVNTYLKLKEALATEELAAAKAVAKTMYYNTKVLKGTTKFTSVNELSDLVSEAKNISIQRRYFKVLSSAIYAIPKSEDQEISFYRKYCPETKAYWLSNTVENTNHYRGDLEITLGFLVEEF